MDDIDLYDERAEAEADAAMMQQIDEYDLVTKRLSGGYYDQNLKQFTQKNFRSVWAGSLSKARREDEMARAMS